MTTKESDLEQVHFQGTTDALNALSIWKITEPVKENTIEPREIEFRFWDSFNEEMTYSEGMKLSKFFEMFEKLQEGGNNPILMRSTGLLDKNVNKIFGGDILKWIGTTGDNDGVEFENVVYFLGYRYRIKCTKNGKTFHCDLNSYQIFNHKCEIIGNIHQK